MEITEVDEAPNEPGGVGNKMQIDTNTGTVYLWVNNARWVPLSFDGYQNDHAVLTRITELMTKSFETYFKAWWSPNP